MVLGSRIRDLGFGLGIQDPRPGIRDPEKTYSGSQIQGLKRPRIPDPQHCIAGIPAIVVIHFVIDIAAVVGIKTEDFMVFALVIFFARLHNLNNNFFPSDGDFAGFSG